MATPSLNVNLRDIVDRLNSMLEADPDAARKLARTYHPCNKALAEHPTCQVNAIDVDNDLYTVGALGWLNGALGIDPSGWGPISAIFDVECGYCGAVNPGAPTGSDCPQCGGSQALVLGRLVRFQLSPPWQAACIAESFNG